MPATPTPTPTPTTVTRSEPLRQVMLGERTITYQLIRAKRRSIGFIVGNHGLAVRAPTWTPLHDIESALREKSNWILKKLFEAEQRLAHSHTTQMVWQDGATLHYLGEPFTLQLGATCAAIDPEQKRLWVALPSTATAAQIQDAAQSTIQRAALLLFEARLNHYAPQLGVHWTSLKLSNAGGRWGSAKSDGTIRLNWRLMHFRLPVIDYVVVHELSHLRHMNHSPRFWDTVEGIMPDYAQLKKELKPV
jgi:predicted metal-dependent hydrolase